MPDLNNSIEAHYNTSTSSKSVAISQLLTRRFVHRHRKNAGLDYSKPSTLIVFDGDGVFPLIKPWRYSSLKDIKHLCLP